MAKIMLISAEPILRHKLVTRTLIFTQVRELHASLESMRTAAVKIPGGHLSTSRIEEMSAMLEAEAEKRR